MAAPLGTSAQSRRWRWAVLVIAVWVVVALLGALLVFQRFGGSSDGDLGTGEIFLEPATVVGSEPFTLSADTNTAPIPTAPPQPAAATSEPGQTAPALRSVVGTSAGLYGGVSGVPSCDVGAIADELEGDAARVTAWARAAGIPSGEARAYLSELSSVVLRADTRVTIYRFSGDRAVARQSVLQTGTAVLVDAFGAPAVRCASGSPLQAPEPARARATYTGDRWAGFRPQAAIVVTRAAAPVDQLVVVDLLAPGYFTRPVGVASAGTAPRDGAVFVDTLCDLYPDVCDPPALRPPGPITGPGGQNVGAMIELRWFSAADLDLAVTDPGGTTVRYDSPSASNGGLLSADTNGACRSPTSNPVETITWPAPAQPGNYVVTVSYYDVCPGGEGAQAYQLSVSGPDVTVVDAGAASGGLPPGVSSRRALAMVGGMAAQDGSSVIDAATSTGLLEQVGEAESISFKVGETFILPKAPGPVQGLTAEINDAGVVVIRWQPNLDPTFGIETSYSIQATAVVGGEERGTELTTVSPELEHPDLPPGVTVTYLVVAENAGGFSPPMSVTITTPDAPVVVPPPPAVPDETLEEYCNRLYGPPPGPFDVNMMWTLCMHDPTDDDIDTSELPAPVP
jgi:hypothetical protein